VLLHYKKHSPLAFTAAFGKGWRYAITAGIDSISILRWCHCFGLHFPAAQVFAQLGCQALFARRLEFIICHRE